MRECAILYNMKIKHILFVLSVLVAVSGCDFFRKVAGRPTSSDIQEKKILIERDKADKLAKAQEQARLDSLAEVKLKMALAEEAMKQDSLAALKALYDQNCMLYDLKSLKGLASGELSHRYYIVIGSFKEEENADKQLAKVEKKNASLEPQKIHFRNRMIAVGVCPSNKLTEVVEVLDEVKAYPFCPKDAWILVNE